MTLLGLTGPVGMGKSTVGAMFAAEGIPLFDSDAVVHRLQGPEGALVREIEAMFPGTTGDGGVNRTALAEVVLDDSEALDALEAIVHPAVAAERASFRRRHSTEPLLVFDIPLLLEKGLESEFDKIAVVSAAPDVQRR